MSLFPWTVSASLPYATQLATANLTNQGGQGGMIRIAVLIVIDE